MTLKAVFRELLANGPGKAGLALLVFLGLCSVCVLVLIPIDFGTTRWSNPAYWADNPKAVPPAWWNWFTPTARFRHTAVSLTEPTTIDKGTSGELRTYAMPFSVGPDNPPTFASISLTNVTFQQGSPSFSVVLERPKGREIVLYREAVRGPRPEEAAPYQRFKQEPLRISLGSQASTAEALGQVFQEEFRSRVATTLLRASLTKALVGAPDASAPDGLRLVPGRYVLKVNVLVADPQDQIGSVDVVAGGSVFGLMGTDALGRDLFQGLAFGLPIALLIGIGASIVSTALGTFLGVVSGYTGGKTDMVIQRLADIVNNVPLLPLLIFLVFIFGANLYLMMFFLVAFSWPGLTILLRTMVLQIRSGPVVESARALGASRWRIMSRHVFPHAAPFVIAQMIFFAPGAILAEAGLSFLGLGDPSMPTWGQILQQGYTTGAVFLGFWWWILPPGVLIIVTALTFMLLSLGIEPAVNPRLRRQR